jgi:hypothetical protein
MSKVIFKGQIPWGNLVEDPAELPPGDNLIRLRSTVRVSLRQLCVAIHAGDFDDPAPSKADLHGPPEVRRQLFFRYLREIARLPGLTGVIDVESPGGHCMFFDVTYEFYPFPGEHWETVVVRLPEFKLAPSEPDCDTPTIISPGSPPDGR